MKRLILALAVSTALYVAPAAAADLVQVYNAPVGLVGGQGNFGGTLGLNFTVNQTTNVAEIGVFDSGSDGLTTALTATIFDSSGNSLLTPVVFASNTPTSGGAYIFAPVSLTLAPGSYQLAAWGFNVANPDYNAFGPGGSITFNGAGALTGDSPSAYNFTPDALATTGDFVGGASNNRYGSASLVLAVPEPASWALMLLGFGMIGFVIRKRSNVRTTVRYA